MALGTSLQKIGKSVAVLASLAAGAYASYVAITWLRYGTPRSAPADDVDPILDRFMPTYHIAERHHIHIAAPADVTLATAFDMDLQQSPVARAIFRGREMMLGSASDETIRPRGLVALTKSLGWGVL